MKMIILKDCIETLKKVQAEKRGTLEAGLAAELDEVVMTLQRLGEEAGESGEVVVAEPVRWRVLELILRLVQAVTNLAEIISRITYGQ